MFCVTHIIKNINEVVMGNLAESILKSFYAQKTENPCYLILPIPIFHLLSHLRTFRCTS